MHAFIIYRGSKPLVWATDNDTQAHTGVAECYFTFATREVATRVMTEVPSLFDLDVEDANVLNIQQITIPG
jgi:hypothetical protein